MTATEPSVEAAESELIGLDKMIADLEVLSQDGLENVLTGLKQDGRDATVRDTWSFVELTPQAIHAMYLSDFIAKRAVNVRAADAVRRWFQLRIEGDDADKSAETSKLVLDALDDLKLRQQSKEALRLDGKDGGCLVVFGLDEGPIPQGVEAQLALELPVRPEALRKVTAIHVVEREAVQADTQITMDPKSPNFGKPEYWVLQNGLSSSNRQRATGRVRLHWTRALALTGEPLPWNFESSRDTWGGVSICQVLDEPLRGYRALLGYIRATFKHWTTLVVKFQGLATLMAQGKEDLVRKRLRLLQWCRSVLGALPIDKEDNVEELAIQMTNAAEMLLRSQDDVAGAAGLPLTLLFGHSPAGFSQDDKPGERNHYDQIADIQQTKLRPLLDRVIELVTLAKEGPTKGQPIGRWDVVFNPLQEPTESELSERRKRDAETDAVLISNQVIDPDEARERLRADPTSPYVLEDKPAPVAGDEPEGEPPAEPATTEEPETPAPGTEADPPGDVPTAEGGTKVADQLVPGITIANVKEIAVAIMAGDVPWDFGVGLAAIALGIPVEQAQALFASLPKEPEKKPAPEDEDESEDTDPSPTIPSPPRPQADEPPPPPAAE